MITEELLSRINELSKKSKRIGLTKQEQQERYDLRKKYLKAFRENFKKQLDSIEVVDD